MLHACLEDMPFAYFLMPYCETYFLELLLFFILNFEIVILALILMVTYECLIWINFDNA